MNTDTTTGNYEVRESRPASNPEDRGTLVSQHRTYAEASAAATKLAAQGRNVFVSSLGAK